MTNLELTLWLNGLAMALAVASIPSVLVRRRGQPMSALSWILALLALPYLGLILWWLLGHQHLERMRRKRRRATAELGRRLAESNLRTRPPSEGELPLLPLKALPPFEEAGVFPVCQGNRARLLVRAEQAYPALEQLIEQAQHHLHVMFYIWQNDQTGRRFRDLLVDAAGRGVEVRVLYDAFGGMMVHGRFMNPLREAGAQVAAFLPARLFRRRPTFNFRNHRKLVVADGQVAFTGGLNLGDEYHHWHDLGILLTGPVVRQLQEVFVEDWFFATKEDLAAQPYFDEGREAAVDERWAGLTAGPPVDSQLVATGPDLKRGGLRDAIFVAVNQCVSRVWLTTPYFVPDASTRAALRTAVWRGVDVRLILPGPSDMRLVQAASRGFYLDLLQAGVRIFEYQPQILHAKALLFDHQLVMLGSANLDNRSFRLNFEASCFLSGEELNQQVAQQLEADMEVSEEITLSALKRHSWGRRLAEGVAQLLSPLL